MKRYFSSLYETVQLCCFLLLFHTCFAIHTQSCRQVVVLILCKLCVSVWGGKGPVKVKTVRRESSGPSHAETKAVYSYVFIEVCDLIQVRWGVSGAAAACDGDKEPTDLNAPPGVTWLLNILKGSLCVCCVLSSSYEWWTERVKYERCNCVIKSFALSVCTARRRFFAFTFRRDVIKELWDFLWSHAVIGHFLKDSKSWFYFSCKLVKYSELLNPFYLQTVM